jgi:hypothetical protein
MDKTKPAGTKFHFGGPNYRTYHGVVKTAINYGTDELPDWYIEWDNAVSGEFGYLKQKPDRVLCVHWDDGTEPVPPAKLDIKVRSDDTFRLLAVGPFHTRVVRSLIYEDELIKMIDGYRSSIDAEETMVLVQNVTLTDSKGRKII